MERESWSSANILWLSSIVKPALWLQYTFLSAYLTSYVRRLTQPRLAMLRRSSRWTSIGTCPSTSPTPSQPSGAGAHRQGHPRLVADCCHTGVPCRCILQNIVGD